MSKVSRDIVFSETNKQNVGRQSVAKSLQKHPNRTSEFTNRKIKDKSVRRLEGSQTSKRPGSTFKKASPEKPINNWVRWVDKGCLFSWSLWYGGPAYKGAGAQVHHLARWCTRRSQVKSSLKLGREINSPTLHTWLWRVEWISDSWIMTNLWQIVTNEYQIMLISTN